MTSNNGNNGNTNKQTKDGKVAAAYSVSNDGARRMRCVSFTHPDGTCGKPATVYVQGTGFAYCSDHETEVLTLGSGRDIVRINR